MKGADICATQLECGGSDTREGPLHLDLQMLGISLNSHAYD